MVFKTAEQNGDNEITDSDLQQAPSSPSLAVSSFDASPEVESLSSPSSEQESDLNSSDHVDTLIPSAPTAIFDSPSPNALNDSSPAEADGDESPASPTPQDTNETQQEGPTSSPVTAAQADSPSLPDSTSEDLFAGSENKQGADDFADWSTSGAQDDDFNGRPAEDLFGTPEPQTSVEQSAIDVSNLESESAAQVESDAPLFAGSAEPTGSAEVDLSSVAQDPSPTTTTADITSNAAFDSTEAFTHADSELEPEGAATNISTDDAKDVSDTAALSSSTLHDSSNHVLEEHEVPSTASPPLPEPLPVLETSPTEEPAEAAEAQPEESTDSTNWNEAHSKEPTSSSLEQNLEPQSLAEPQPTAPSEDATAEQTPQAVLDTEAPSEDLSQITGEQTETDSASGEQPSTPPHLTTFEEPSGVVDPEEDLFETSISQPEDAEPTEALETVGADKQALDTDFEDSGSNWESSDPSSSQFNAIEPTDELESLPPSNQTSNDSADSKPDEDLFESSTSQSDDKEPSSSQFNISDSTDQLESPPVSNHTTDDWADSKPDEDLFESSTSQSNHKESEDLFISSAIDDHQPQRAEEDSWAAHESTDQIDSGGADDFADWTTGDKDADEWVTGDANDDDFADFGDFQTPSEDPFPSSNDADPAPSAPTPVKPAEASKITESTSIGILRGSKTEVTSKIAALLAPLNSARLDLSVPLSQEKGLSLESMAAAALNSSWQAKDSKRAPKPLFRGTFFETNFLAALGKQPLPSPDQDLSSFIKRTPTFAKRSLDSSASLSAVPFALSPSQTQLPKPTSSSDSISFSSDVAPLKTDDKSLAAAPSAAFDLSLFGPAPTTTSSPAPATIKDEGNWMSSFMTPSSTPTPASMAPVASTAIEVTITSPLAPLPIETQQDSVKSTTSIDFMKQESVRNDTIVKADEAPVDEIGRVLADLMKSMPDLSFMHETSIIASSKRI